MVWTPACLKQTHRFRGRFLPSESPRRDSRDQLRPSPDAAEGSVSGQLAHPRPAAACAATPDRASGRTASGMGSTCFSARSIPLGLTMARPKVMDASTENSSRSSAMTGPRRSARSVPRHRSDPIGRRSAPLRGRSDAVTGKPAQRGPFAGGQLPSGKSHGRTTPPSKRSEARPELRSGARIRIGCGGSRLSAPTAFAVSRKG